MKSLSHSVREVQVTDVTFDTPTSVGRGAGSAPAMIDEILCSPRSGVRGGTRVFTAKRVRL